MNDWDEAWDEPWEESNPSPRPGERGRRLKILLLLTLIGVLAFDLSRRFLEDAPPVQRGAKDAQSALAQERVSLRIIEDAMVRDDEVLLFGDLLALLGDPRRRLTITLEPEARAGTLNQALAALTLTAGGGCDIARDGEDLRAIRLAPRPLSRDLGPEVRLGLSRQGEAVAARVDAGGALVLERADDPRLSAVLREALEAARSRGGGALVLAIDGGLPAARVLEVLLLANELGCADIHGFVGEDPSPRPKPPRVSREDEELEEVIDKALGWLLRHQSEDGSWRARAWAESCGDPACGGGQIHAGLPQHRLGLTGLALLALIRSGRHHRDGSSAEALRRGLDWIGRQQAPDGSFGRKSGSLLNHSLPLMALCEAVNHSGDRRLLPIIRRAVGFALLWREPGGGWKNARRRGTNSHTTSWMVQALLSAHEAGIDIPQAVFSDVAVWLDKATEDNGTVGYTSRGFQRPVNAPFVRHPTLTACALSTQLRVGIHYGTKRLRRGAKQMRAAPPVWEKSERRNEVHHYYWFHGAQVVAEREPGSFPDWIEALKEALIPHQGAEGCAAGSWEPAGEWGRTGGRVYSTALGALALRAVAGR